MEPPVGERTAAVHGPRASEPGSLTTPIHQTSTFVLASADDVDAVYEGRREGDVYSRYSNPSVRAVEERVAMLEGAPAAAAYASGMGAITTTVLAFVPPGGRIVANEDLYGGVANFLKWMRDRLGVRVDLVPTTDAAALARALRERADLCYLETPTNPTLRLVDLAAAAEAARAAGVPTAVDSTFASPVNSKPRALGVDLVLHSATKYLGGHGDLTAGVVCGSKEHVARVHAVGKMLGPTLDPHAAFLVERGLKTLPLRVKAINANAQAVAEHLARHPAVHAVHYPGLASHPQHALAKRQMPGGYGGVLSFDVATFADAKKVLDGFRVIRNAASLGGVESLCSLPYQQSHRGQPKDALARSGITEGTIRLAVGVEDADDLLRDLDQALAGLRK
jgi:cystathionine beta-lyase/cystathionine gamma-synthase